MSAKSDVKPKMREEKKNNVRNSVIRLVISVLGFVVQTLWFVVLVVRLNAYSETIEIITKLVSLFIVLSLSYNDNLNSNMKITWIIAILIFPILGLSLYMMYGRHGSVGMARKRHSAVLQKLNTLSYDDQAIFQKLFSENPRVANEFRYIREYGRYPMYECRNIQYFADPMDGLNAHIEAIRQAEKYIFIEYHAIEDSVAFERMLKELEIKVSQGVEVRIIYDDVGSVGFLNLGFIKKMKDRGIECRVFNEVIPVLNIFMQNRDHRKIMVVDNKIAFTGGYNLADEYFGYTHPYGQWKDTGICFDGPAVNSMTAFFLYMWNLIKDTDKTIDRYFDDTLAMSRAAGQRTPQGQAATQGQAASQDQATRQTVSGEQPQNGYIVPYGGNPLSNEHVAENVYMNVIKNATSYLYITTPYLILSCEMQRELELAAKRGVDVRIVTPGIPDKKIIYKATRSYYHFLVASGVKIYEYTPGFMHAKMFLSDNEVAVIGTINMDYRSLYHHFENAVLMYKVPILQEILEDFRAIFEQSADVSDGYLKGHAQYHGLRQMLLRLFAPLL